MEQTKISSSHGTHAPHAARGRQSNDAAGAAGSPGSFLALLSAQEDVASDGMLGDVKGDVSCAGAKLSDMASDATPDAVDALEVAAWQGLVAPDAAVLPQNFGQTSGALVGGGMGTSGWSGALEGDGGLRQGLVAETSLLDGAADLKDSGLQGSTAGYGRIFSRMQSALAQRATNVGHGGLADGAAGRQGPAIGAQHAASTHQILANGFQNGAENAAVTAGQAPGVHGERERGLISAALAPESLSLGGAGLASLSFSARGSEASAGGRHGEGQSGGPSWFDGAADVAPLETGGVDGSSIFADPTQVGAEEYVTDQVAYWVNQKTQNAELTLDRDGSPVEVSVSLSGNEAHVTFRSDQSDTRELLDRSMAQLSDLLHREGLVLSGMSVGTSTRDGAGGDTAAQPRNREGERRAQVVSAAPANSGAEPRMGGATDRAVDIFV